MLRTRYEFVPPVVLCIPHEDGAVLKISRLRLRSKAHGIDVSAEIRFDLTLAIVIPFRVVLWSRDGSARSYKSEIARPSVRISTYARISSLSTVQNRRLYASFFAMSTRRKCSPSGRTSNHHYPEWKFGSRSDVGGVHDLKTSRVL